MKLKSIMLAAGLLAVPTIALAQSAPSPTNQSGPNVSPSVQAPTDMGSGAAASGNTKATPERKATGMQSMTKGSKKAPTTGSNIRETKKKNASPASGAEGAEKVK